jgi:hypothetical protein
MEGVSRQEFADAVSAAVASVKHFYREVDRLVATLKESLLAEPDPLKVVRGSTGKGTSMKQHGRVVLRDDFSILFEPVADDDAAGDEPDDEDEGEEGDDEEPVATGRRRSAPAELDPDQPVLALLLNLATSRPAEAFEPTLQYGVLGEWGIGPGGASPEGPLLLKRYMLKRVAWVLERPDTSKRMLTHARVIGKGKKSKGADRTLSCRIMGGVHTVALYDLDQPKALDDLAEAMRAHWRQVLDLQAPGAQGQLG